MSGSNICVTFPWFRHFPANIIKFENSKKKKAKKKTQAFMLWEDKNIWMITLAKFWLFAVSTGSS